MINNRYAGVDIGSGSARLAICEIIDNDARTKYFELFGHNLGNDNKTYGELKPQTIEDTMKMFARMLELCEQYEVKAVQFSATEAIRAAKNSADFLARVKQEYNIDIKILDESEEAGFAYLGAKKLFNENAKNVLVMDIGRGSIETALGSTNHDLPLEYISHKLGTMVFKDRFDNKETLDQEFQNVIDEVKSNFKTMINDWNLTIENSDQLIGLGMSLFTYGYIHGLQEDEMVKGEGMVLSLDELYLYAQTQLNHLRNDVCYKTTTGVISQADIPVLATLIALIEASGLSSITLGRTRIPQALALQLAGK